MRLCIDAVGYSVVRSFALMQLLNACCHCHPCHVPCTTGNDSHKAWQDGKYSNLVKDDPSAAGMVYIDVQVDDHACG
jgi:hypothetical protein